MWIALTIVAAIAAVTAFAWPWRDRITADALLVARLVPIAVRHHVDRFAAAVDDLERRRRS